MTYCIKKYEDDQVVPDIINNDDVSAFATPTIM